MEHKIPSLVLLLGLLIPASPLLAQNVVGTTSRGGVVSEDVSTGWSIKQSLLGKFVYNEKEERVGAINDLIIGPEGTISHVVVAAGPFVGEKRHDVAIDAASLESRNGRFYVEGATRENVKAVPKFEYAVGL